MSIFRLGLTLPSQASWDADFGISVCQFLLYFARVRVPGYENNVLKIFNRRSSLIAKSRQELVQDAIKEHCSHVLFVDSDQIFPPIIAHQLAKHGKRFIGCNIATKSQEKSIPTARAKPGPQEWWGGHVVYSQGRKGIERIWRLGFGVMLIDLEVFKDLPLPWFNQEWRNDVQEFCGEDWYFCEKMEAKGVPLWVDHDLSVQIGHVGRWIYTHNGIIEDKQVNKEVA